MKEGKGPDTDWQELFSRQLAIPGWSPLVQTRLAESHVGIAGIGGLGSPVSLYLAGAGIGRLTLVDSGKVELSNLNRQILFSLGDQGKDKQKVACDRIRNLNGRTRVTGWTEEITDGTVASLFSTCDLIVDCLDGFSARHVLNRFCWKNSIPLVHGGIREYFGQIFVMKPPDTACLNCFLPEQDNMTETVPVLGAVAGVLGSLQAMEALKVLGRLEQSKTGVLHMIDLLGNEMEKIPINQRPDCVVCSLT